MQPYLCRLACTVLLCCLSVRCLPQSPGFDSLDINTIHARVYADGYLFWDRSTYQPRFESPAGGGNSTFFAAQLWLSALDSTGQLRVLGPTYAQTGRDLWAGPAADDYTLPAYDARYNRVWKLHKSVIDAHLLQWNTPGYQVPAILADWPAHGDTANGEGYFLAPFEDLNQNQRYEPEAGEYPSIRGDQAIFFIANDLREPHTESGGLPLGVELHGMLYGYDAPPDSAFGQTVLLNYRVINRSPRTYPQLHVAFFGDLDIGFAGDDYAGCDLTANMAFAYNADTADLLYGPFPPAQGIVWLSDGLAGFHVYRNDFSATGNPQTPQDYYRYMTGSWKDGTPVTAGSNGYGGSTPTRYMYPGDPVAPAGWTMSQAGAPGGVDIRSLTVLKDQALPVSGVTCFDLAFPFAQDTAGSHLTAISRLRTYADQIAQWYYGPQQPVCLPLPVLTTRADPAAHAGSLILRSTPQGIEVEWPRPPGGGSSAELLDLCGRVVYQSAFSPSGRHLLPAAVFPSGVCIIRLRAGSTFLHRTCVLPRG